MTRRRELQRDYIRALEAQRLAQAEVDELESEMLEAKGLRLKDLKKRLARAQDDLEDCHISVSAAEYDWEHEPYEKPVSTMTPEQRRANLESALDDWINE